MGDFFGNLGAAGRALWDFMDGFYGIAVTVVSVGLIVGFLTLARLTRESKGWLSATFGMMGTTVAAFWAFGIIPSAWVYFMDGQRDVLAGRVVPESLDPVAANFFEVFRDVVVMAETGLAVGLFAFAALQVQKRFSRALAEGEQPRPQSGGYK